MSEESYGAQYCEPHTGALLDRCDNGWYKRGGNEIRCLGAGEEISTRTMTVPRHDRQRVSVKCAEARNKLDYTILQ